MSGLLKITVGGDLRRFTKKRRHNPAEAVVSSQGGSGRVYLAILLSARLSVERSICEL